MKAFRNGVAGSLIALVPATASFAETRPNAAVPMAGSAAVAAQYSDDDDGSPWLAFAAIGLAVVVAAWILLSDDDDGEGALSRA